MRRFPRGALGPTRLVPATVAVMAVLLGFKCATFIGVQTGQAAEPESGARMVAQDAGAARHGGAERPLAVAPNPAARAPATGSKGVPRPSGTEVTNGGSAAASAAGPATAPAAAAACPTAALGAAPAPAPAGEVSEAERALLMDLRARRATLDARQDALVSRERLIAAAEAKLGERAEELEALRQKLVDLDAARRARDEAGLRGLVRMYEQMRPRDAAAIFNDLDAPTLLQLVDRMKEAKAAAVLAAMQPDRARQLTTALADSRLRTASGASDEPAASGSNSPARPAPNDDRR